MSIRLFINFILLFNAYLLEINIVFFIQGRAWYTYVDPDVTLDQLRQLTDEFLAIFKKCPSKLKRKILQSQLEVWIILTRLPCSIIALIPLLSISVLLLLLCN